MLQAQIFIDKDELIGEKPLYEFIMQFLLLQHVKGATAFKGVMGFGEKEQMKRPNQLFSFDEPPMMITFIDDEEKVMQVWREVAGSVR